MRDESKRQKEDRDGDKMKRIRRSRSPNTERGFERGEGWGEGNGGGGEAGEEEDEGEGEEQGPRMCTGRSYLNSRNSMVPLEAEEAQEV